jgi:RimJ/RimL family protein N-acetyltransferase
MRLSFELIERDWEDVAAWISGDVWPFHFRSRPRLGEVLVQAEAGFVAGEDVRSFWVSEEGVRLALIRIFDLADLTPLFDLRVESSNRGRGVGEATLRWATEFVFGSFESAYRFGGYTRADNVGMRRVFEKVGFVLEARHRDGWRCESGALVDSLGYAILRREWRPEAQP